MSTSTTIRVVTQRTWMVDELRAVTDRTDWTVQQHYGLSLPQADGALYWMPGAFAARLQQLGHCPALSSPGGAYLALLPREFLRREVALFPAVLAMLQPSEGFWKLADSKDERFPAAWRTADRLTVDLQEARIPPTAMLQLTDVRLDLAAEYRAIICGRTVLTGSFYRDQRGVATDDPDYREPPEAQARAAIAFATEVIAATTDSAVTGPTSFTLDVGFDRSLGWVVVEANPIWSAAWYAANPALYVTALITDQMTDPGIWTWKPDPVLSERAARLPSLPQDRAAAPRAAPPPVRAAGGAHRVHPSPNEGSPDR